jgi:hypothetical protein
MINQTTTYYIARNPSGTLNLFKKKPLWRYMGGYFMPQPGDRAISLPESMFEMQVTFENSPQLIHMNLENIM